MSEHTTTPGALSDEALVEAFQKGSLEAFNLLVGRFKDPLMNFAFRFLGSREEADDIVQETFIRLYEKKESYRPVAKFSTWLYTITANLARTHLRRRRREQLFPLLRGGKEDEHDHVWEARDENPGPDIAAQRSIEHALIQRALDDMPVKFREIVIWSDIEDHSYEEIASITGLSLGTVKSRLSRGRARLKKLLEGKLDG